jgi:hypothetical protein
VLPLFVQDVLLQNSDRHHGHFLWAEHWSRSARAGQTPGSNGSNRPWQGVKSMVLIDHAAGFRPEAFVDMRHDNAFGTGSTEVISARTFLRLRYACTRTHRQMVLSMSLGWVFFRWRCHG